MRSKKERRPYWPSRGAVYRNHGGGIGVCARMENVESGWTFQANGIHRYPDGSIDWNFSTGGRFLDGKPRNMAGGKNG